MSCALPLAPRHGLHRSLECNHQHHVPGLQSAAAPRSAAAISCSTAFSCNQLQLVLRPGTVPVHHATHNFPQIHKLPFFRSKGPGHTTHNDSQIALRLEEGSRKARFGKRVPESKFWKKGCRKPRFGKGAGKKVPERDVWIKGAGKRGFEKGCSKARFRRGVPKARFRRRVLECEV